MMRSSCHFLRSKLMIFTQLNGTIVISMQTFLFKLQSFPFDSKNPIGYCLAFFFECMALWYMYWYIVGVVSLAFSSFLFSLVLIEDIKNNLNAINKTIKMKEINRFLVLKRISDFTNLHTNFKQLRKNTNDISTLAFFKLSAFFAY